jgi:hypothetical protein
LGRCERDPLPLVGVSSTESSNSPASTLLTSSLVWLVDREIADGSCVTSVRRDGELRRPEPDVVLLLDREAVLPFVQEFLD